MRKKKLEHPADAYLDLPMLEVDALYESNLIEGISSMEALEDAIEAWKFAKANKDDLMDTSLLKATEYVLGIHKRLMKRLEPGIAGKFRDCDVWIGGEHKVFVDECALREQLNEWIIDSTPKDEYRSKPIAKREALAKEWHVLYEQAHVTTDGNGRNGRILYQIHRIMLGLPVKVIESSTKRENYYTWFREDPVEKMMRGLIEEGL